MKASGTEDPPWWKAQMISLPESTLPPLALLHEGWKELEHTELQTLKEKIAECTSTEAWELRKMIVNPYEAIFHAKEEGSFPSLATVHPLSRSYFKMIEMLNTFHLGPPISGPITTAHICEGPGGFIQALTYELHKQGKVASKISAMTLKPSKNNIPGWRRSVQYLRAHKEIQLVYGEDGTGNILHSANQDAFVRGAHGVQLFTADGGFDFSVDYNTQELQAFELLIASFSIGLRSLGHGGNMIVKLFDMYSQATQDLLLGSAVFFKEFCIYKPATSRPCNSERYFIAKGYKGSGVAARWIAHLERAANTIVHSPITRLCAADWPLEVQTAMREQIVWQEEQQIQNIERALTLQYKDIPAYITECLNKSILWCKTFGVPFTHPT